ncbi:His-Xaa-Ser system radical SAM maturase HxsB [Patescibacteria group bacterium]|nr:His-Xaa-Ser system radical SAM maturase HxsB [Patescibacteria group bacterium]
MNNYRVKKFNDKFLITTDHGSWVFLNNDQFNLLTRNEIDKDVKFFELLEEKGIILTSKNEKRVIISLRKKYDFLFIGTSLHIIVPTLRCNQKCTYCHAGSKSLDEYVDMDEKTANAVVDFIFQSPSKKIAIEFQGGEPLLRFDIVKQIIEYAKKINNKFNKDLIFIVVTNLSLMDEDKLDYFIKNNVNLCTSLDGPEYIHNKNRVSINNQSHEFVEKWIKKMQEENHKRKINKKINVLLTTTKESLNYSKEIINEYARLGLNEIFLRPLNKLGNAKSVWDRLGYTPEEFIEFWKKSIDYLLELNKKGVIIREYSSLFILQKLIDGIEPNYFEQRSPCGAAIGQLAYNFNGDIYTCDEARMIDEDLFRLGNVHTDNYKNVILSNQTCSMVAASINDTQICDNCAFKPYCGICPVCNYAEHGSIITNISSSARCKIYMAQFKYLFDKIENDSEAYNIFCKWLNQK